jgi:ElaA protein
MEFDWQIKHYNELTVDEFHDLIQLRIEVFVIEQNCPYQELDGKDKDSFHVIGRSHNGEICATSRILPQGISYPNDVSIGRVVVSSNNRGTSLGHELTRQCLKFIEAHFGHVSIRISAQAHLTRFYQSHGFVETGKSYLEDGIPHVEMLNKP